MKMYGGIKLWLHAFLTSVLEGSEYQVQAPFTLTPVKYLPYPLAKKLHDAEEGLDMIAQERIHQADTNLTELFLTEHLVIRNARHSVCTYP
jgi:hypothetical protein